MKIKPVKEMVWRASWCSVQNSIDYTVHDLGQDPIWSVVATSVERSIGFSIGGFIKLSVRDFLRESLDSQMWHSVWGPILRLLRDSLEQSGPGSVTISTRLSVEELFEQKSKNEN